MAPPQKLLFFLLLFFIILSSQSQARNIQSFSKFNNKTLNHQNLSKNSSETLPDPTKNKTTEEQLPSFVRETGNAYGLYGHESKNNDDNENDKFIPTSEHQESYNYKDNYPKSNEEHGNRNGGQEENFGENRLMETNYNAKRDVNPGNYGYDEPQGMSDTRFLEYGKYFYDLGNENNNNYYYKPNRYYSRNGPSRNYDEYRSNGYGGTSSNDMGWYPKKQDGNEEEEVEEFEP